MPSAEEHTSTPSSPRTVLHLVPVEFVGAAWQGAVDELVSAACDRDGLYGADDLFSALCKGLMRLWVAGSKKDGGEVVIEAVAVTEILQFPRMKAFGIVICTGQDRQRWVSHLRTMEAWAKEQGCGMSRPITRKGWAKDLSDYRLTHYVWEKRL